MNALDKYHERKHQKFLERQRQADEDFRHRLIYEEAKRKERHFKLQAVQRSTD